MIFRRTAGSSTVEEASVYKTCLRVSAGQRLYMHHDLYPRVLVDLLPRELVRRGVAHAEVERYDAVPADERQQRARRTHRAYCVMVLRCVEMRCGVSGCLDVSQG